MGNTDKGLILVLIVTFVPGICQYYVVINSQKSETAADSQFEACIHCHGVLILLPIKYFSTIILTAACRYDMIRNGLSKL